MRRERDAAIPPQVPLARPHDRMAEGYDVVVVGSGYGGAIAAARFSRAGRSVCILERGRELQAGDFPASALAAVRQLQVRRGPRRFGPRAGLFDLHTGDDLNVVVGCGLGGTSLINAGVALRPPDWVFDDDRWPAALRGDRGPSELGPYFARAESMLGSTPFPGHFPTPTKLAALERAASGVGMSVTRPPLNVTFTDGPNAAGIEQRACVLCGDCVTGCNHRAKNTVAENYLPDAVAHGAHVFCEATVRRVAHAAAGIGRRWTVEFAASADGRARFVAPASFVFADVVVLAAGTLGSTQILLGSRAGGLAVSPRLGDRFTGNGDVLAFAYGVDGTPRLRGIGAGRRPLTPDNEVGPCITGAIDLTGTPTPGKGALVEEGAIPGALRPFMPAAFAVAAGLDQRGGVVAAGRRLARRVRATAAAAIDPSGGRLRPDGDGLRVEWPAVGDLPIFDHNADVLRRASEAAGGEYVANPLWSPLLRESLVTVHPLGGCAMADDGAHGVVDHRGRVFTGDGDDVHEGLMVVDGAVVPRPLAVNPLLTISAISERSAALLAADRGWDVEEGPTPRLVAPPGSRRPGIRFTERMAGWAGTSTCRR
jgi:cholesterol oxidase